EVEGVLHAGIHAEPAVRRVRMRGVAGEKHAPIHEAGGDDHLAHPEADVLDDEGNVAPDAAPARGRNVDRLQLAIRDSGKLQAIQVSPIDGREHRPGTLLPDEHVTIGLALVVESGEILDTDIHAHRKIEMRLTPYLDAERGANRAAGPVAADEILAIDRSA